MFLNSFKKNGQKDINEFAYDQAVVLEINLEGLDDFGTADQHKEIDDLQENIAQILPPNAGIDGDEYGDGECIIYIYGPSADAIFNKVQPVLKSSSFNHINVTLQYGLAEDPATIDKKFTL